MPAAPVKPRVALPPPLTGEGARVFLQDRLAHLGAVYFSLPSPSSRRGPGPRDPHRDLEAPWPTTAGLRLVLGTAAVSFTQWWLCQLGPRPKGSSWPWTPSPPRSWPCSTPASFRAVSRRAWGLSYARALLLLTLGLVVPGHRGAELPSPDPAPGAPGHRLRRRHQPRLALGPRGGRRRVGSARGLDGALLPGGGRGLHPGLARRSSACAGRCARRGSSASTR